MGQKVAYIKSADMKIEYFILVDKVSYLMKTTDGNKPEFYMFIETDDLGIAITEMDYNDLIQMMKG